MILGFQATDEEIDDVVALLESLTDTTFIKNPKFSNPFDEGGLKSVLITGRDSTILKIVTMRAEESIFKKTALGLTLIYFCLSFLMTISVERHLSEHGHHAEQKQRAGHDHRVHASLACAWMCTASTFIHSDDRKPNPVALLSPESPIIDSGLLSSHSALFSNPIRPPPSR